MWTRRVFAGALAPLLLPRRLALGQGAANLPRIAIVEQGEPVESIGIGRHPWWDALLTSLDTLGYVEGETVVIERWTAAGQDDAGFANLVASVVGTRPAIIVARGQRMIDAFRNAATDIPVVGIGTFSNAYALERRDFNVTGLAVTSGIEIYMKHLQILQETVPGASRMGWLGPPDFWAGPIGDATRAGAGRLGLTLVPAFVEAPTGEDSVRRAFAAMPAGDFPALYVSSSPDMVPFRRAVAELTMAAKLPALALHRDYADAGVMMAYGPDFPGVYRRGAGYIDRIFHGERPGDMPIEQPTTFEFVVNLQTASALGLTLPAAIMLMATEFIE